MAESVIRPPSSDRAVAASIGKNTLYGIAGSVVHMLARVLVVPVAIHHLGLEGYGIWAVLMTIAAYMTLGSAGIKSAFQKYVAESTGTGEFERASRLLSTGTAAVLLISAVVLLPVAACSTQLAVVVGVPNAFLPAASKSIVLLALSALFANVTQTYQSVIMGAHRIDLREKINLVIEPFNALITVGFLYFGFGLISMSVVFCAYQIVGGIFWYIYARRVLPVVHVAPRFISRSAIKELVRFAGSYQLLNSLELLYAAILPIGILKCFGAAAAGIFALSARLVSVATLIQGPYLQAVLSGGSLVYAASSNERANAFVTKSFKAMSLLSIIPLAFIALYGTRIAWIWTGSADPLLAGTIMLLCAANLCRSLSSLFRVLYRVSGGAVMDNAQLILALAVALVVTPFGTRIGFLGMVGGVQVAGQFVGLLLIFLSLASRFKGFRPGALAPDFLRLCAATAIIIAVSVLPIYVGVPWRINLRALETIRLLAATAISLLVAGPALLLTGSISTTEARMMLDTFWRKASTTT